jgi:hypothetical protein
MPQSRVHCQWETQEPLCLLLPKRSCLRMLCILRRLPRHIAPLACAHQGLQLCSPLALRNDTDEALQCKTGNRLVTVELHLVKTYKLGWWPHACHPLCPGYQPIYNLPEQQTACMMDDNLRACGCWTDAPPQMQPLPPPCLSSPATRTSAWPIATPLHGFCLPTHPPTRYNTGAASSCTIHARCSSPALWGCIGGKAWHAHKACHACINLTVLCWLHSRIITLNTHAAEVCRSMQPTSRPWVCIAKREKHGPRHRTSMHSAQSLVDAKQDTCLLLRSCNQKPPALSILLTMQNKDMLLVVSDVQPTQFHSCLRRCAHCCIWQEPFD